MIKRFFIIIILFLFLPVMLFGLKKSLSTFDKSGNDRGGFYSYTGEGAWVKLTNDKNIYASGNGSLKILIRTPGSSKNAYHGVMVKPYYSGNLHDLSPYTNGGIVFYARSSLSGFPLPVGIRAVSRETEYNVDGGSDNTYKKKIYLSLKWEKHIIRFSDMGFDPQKEYAHEFGFDKLGFGGPDRLQTCNIDEIYFMDEKDLEVEENQMDPSVSELEFLLLEIDPNYLIYTLTTKNNICFEHKINMDSYVSIEVMDLYGNNIITLLDKKLSLASQYYNINWNGLNKQGNKLESGIYIVNIIAESKERSIKIVKQEYVIIGN